MPNRHKARQKDDDHDDTSSSSSASSKVRIAFYDTTPYFREYFHRVADEDKAEVRFKWIESRLNEETAEDAKDCQVACVFVSDKVDAGIVKQLHKHGVRMIAVRSAGFNNVDLKACDELGITVARVPAYSPYAVAEYATALILSLNRRTHHAYQRVRDYNFSLNRLVGFDMHGKTVGVFGTGKIGQCFIDIMLGFGCKVLCYDVVKAKALEGRKHVTYMSMDDVFQRSDIISLHLPLVKETRHIINKHTLGMMKPHALVINTGRGELVNTADLLDALRNEKIGGAGLDVYEEEGEYFYQDLSEEIVKDRDLLEVINQPNCMLTSHQAFLTQEALTGIAKTTLGNIKEYAVEGKKMGQLTNSLNKKGKDDKDGGKEDGKAGAKADVHNEAGKVGQGGEGRPAAHTGGVTQHHTSAGSIGSRGGDVGNTGQSTDRQWAMDAVRAAVAHGQRSVTAESEPIKFASRL